jgi:hypothetical protein
MLVFSPTLAATIGLEEAVLLYQLHDLGATRTATPGEWQTIEFETLERLLPFWNRDDLQRIAASLVDKGVLETEWTSRAGIAAALCFRQAPAGRPASAAAAPPAMIAQPPVATPAARTTAVRTTAVRTTTVQTTAPALRDLSIREPRPTIGASLLASNWQPLEDTLQALALKNIPREFAIGQLEEFICYWRERGRAEYAWDNKFRLRVIERWERSRQTSAEATFKAAQPPATLDRSWYPDVDALQILERSGISREFIEDSIPEFVLYWREIGDKAIAGNSISWGSKFIAHVRRQWSRYTNALEHDQEPRPIAANWQPSEDLYDILRMANIDILFACEQLPEFILFWQDAGTPQRSWNTKFLQHIKYQWAARHHLTGANRAGYSLAAGGGAQPALSTFEQLTDRSWAVGLVDGV